MLYSYSRSDNHCPINEVKPVLLLIISKLYKIINVIQSIKTYNEPVKQRLLDESLLLTGKHRNATEDKKFKTNWKYLKATFLFRI